MLQSLRDKSSSWIAKVILALLLIPFAFFGVEQYLQQRVDTYAARVSTPPTWWKSAPDWGPFKWWVWKHDEISVEDFRARFEQQREQQRAAAGEAFDARAFETIENKRAVLDRLIDERVMRINAERAGIVVSDAEVRDAIQSLPEFQVDGKFDAQRYQLALQATNPPRTPLQFEQLVRESLQQSQVPARLSESSFVTASELDRMMALLGEKRDVSVVQLPAPAPDTGAVTGAEMQKWYREHASEYRAPETSSIEYVELNAATLPVPQADEAELRRRYDAEKARFAATEQRQTAHILIALDPKADAATAKAAEQKAAKLAEQAKQPGADFAALARANSDDPGSKAAGGDLGFVEKGAGLAKPFEDAVFSMQSGQVSAPVKTEFGYHIIKLGEVKTGQQLPFEQVRDQLAQEQAEADREKAFNDMAGRLVDLVYKNPTALEPAAREMNLPVQKLGPFPRGGGEGLAANPAIQRAAFSETLVQDGTVSDPIEIAPNHSVLIRVVDHKPERTLPLADVRDRVVAAVRADRTKKASAAAADAFLARVTKGETLEAVAASQGLQATPIPGLPRGAPIPSPEANEAIFAVAKPAAGKVSAGKADMTDGSHVVFAVSKVEPGSKDALQPAQREQMRNQMAQMKGIDASQAYVSAVRKRMKVEVAEDRL